MNDYRYISILSGVADECGSMKLPVLLNNFLYFSTCLLFLNLDNECLHTLTHLMSVFLYPQALSEWNS